MKRVTGIFLKSEDEEKLYRCTKNISELLKSVEPWEPPKTAKRNPDRCNPI
jgi:hypothetical protein